MLIVSWYAHFMNDFFILWVGRFAWVAPLLVYLAIQYPVIFAKDIFMMISTILWILGASLSKVAPRQV